MKKKLLTLVLLTCSNFAFGYSVTLLNNSADNHIVVKYDLCTDTKTCTSYEAKLDSAKFGKNWLTINFADNIQLAKVREAKELDDKGNLIAKSDYSKGSVWDEMSTACSYLSIDSVTVFDDMHSGKFIVCTQHHGNLDWEEKTLNHTNTQHKLYK